MFKFTPDLAERFEGDRLFLSNVRLNTILQLSGTAIDKYYRLKTHFESHINGLKIHDHVLYQALCRCSILEDNDAPLLATAGSTKRPLIRSAHGSLISKFAPLGILWEITPKCNLYCIYCHTSSPEQHRKGIFQELTFSQLMVIADRLISAGVFSVVLSGGEALLRGKDTFDLIHHLRDNKIFVSLLTNGFLLNEAAVSKLKEFGVVVGVSLDTYNEGKQAVTRGRAAFPAAVRAIKRLVDADAPFNVICTLTRHNYNDLDTFLDFVESLGTNSVAIQNLIPCESIQTYQDLKLTADQEASLPQYLPALIKRHPQLTINTTEVAIFAHLAIPTEDIFSDEDIGIRDNHLMGGCSACRNGGFVDASGVFYPCTSLRMLPLGNLLDKDLFSLWIGSENASFVRELLSQTTDTLPECQDCRFREQCNSGCRGQAYTLNRDWYALHDRCPKKLEITWLEC